MHCPFCNNQDTKVYDSRHNAEDNTVKRRRKCEMCQKRFTTYEKLELEMPIVVKSDGRREFYNREKIFQGIQKACQKRPVSVNKISDIIDLIEKTIIEQDENEISTNKIGSMVIEHLRKLDPVAYVRFASVYKTFKDVEEFVKDLEQNEELKKGIGVESIQSKPQLS